MKKESVVLMVFLIAVSASLPAAAQSDFDQKKFDLGSSSPTVVVAAIDYFKRARTLKANDVLLERLGMEKNPGMKTRLIEALDVNRSTSAFAAVASLAGDPNRQLAHSAVLSLGRAGKPAAAIPIFEKVLQDPAASNQVKQAVVNVLGAHISTDSVRLLDSVAANTGNPSVMRQQAVSSMRRFGTKDAADKVKKYVNDKDAAVKGEARKKKDAQ